MTVNLIFVCEYSALLFLVTIVVKFLLKAKFNFFIILKLKKKLAFLTS